MLPQDQVRVLRVIDAALNRGREGLRVVEDYVRFVLDDAHLTGQMKALRHELTALFSHLSLGRRLAARETQADVGTGATVSSERLRTDPHGVLAANFTRLEESLRTLEEFGKILDLDLAAKLEQLRYRTYTIQRAVEITKGSLERLGRARLYVLVDARPSPEQFTALVRSLVDAGVDALQFRDKTLEDRRLLDRARLLRQLTLRSDTLFIMNDRPDLAVLARADGVHVGQQDLTVKDARTIVGPDALVGVSTHSIDQARQAVLDGANYLGVGPTFPSGTKRFDKLPGPALLRAVAAEIRLPAFAIGGIDRENLPEVLATGFCRIAVSGAITAAPDPAAAARELKAGLEGSGFRVQGSDPNGAKD
ncbi:MAG: thiamine-phosphate diphosphorylase [Planctomycetes bacterium RBG_16_64_12]|nr:MAG: thiamine-phosphate diphosphorylase [Planctomycetes bacterium RBG_16_64_12]